MYNVWVATEILYPVHHGQDLAHSLVTGEPGWQHLPNYLHVITCITC